MADDKVVITREFNAPVEKVWAAWTEPAQIKKWWGPKTFTAPTVQVDFREGGKYFFSMQSDAWGNGREMFSTGTYKEIIPFKKIVCTDSFADEQGNVVSGSYYGMSADIPLELQVTIAFEDLGDGRTKMTLTHVGMIPSETDDMTNGWNESFDKLAESLR
jgi:uncharacterized protein YndB with AHSA1/START domain